MDMPLSLPPRAEWNIQQCTKICELDSMPPPSPLHLIASHIELNLRAALFLQPSRILPKNYERK